MIAMTNPVRNEFSLQGNTLSANIKIKTDDFGNERICAVVRSVQYSSTMQGTHNIDMSNISFESRATQIPTPAFGLSPAGWRTFCEQAEGLPVGKGFNFSGPGNPSLTIFHN